MVEMVDSHLRVQFFLNQSVINFCSTTLNCITLLVIKEIFAIVCAFDMLYVTVCHGG